MFKRLFRFLNKEESPYTKWFREWNPYIDFQNMKFQATTLYNIDYTRFFDNGTAGNFLEGPVFTRMQSGGMGVIVKLNIPRPITALIVRFSESIPPFTDFAEYRREHGEMARQKALYAFHLYMALLEIFVCNHPMIKYKENYKKIN